MTAGSFSRKSGWKSSLDIMAFAKDYREEITLAYYCFNLALTVAVFIVGTIYLRHRDRRDQQRRDDRDRRDQQRRESRDRREQQRREWRQFAERIYSDYSKLKEKNIPRKISKVRDTFQEIRMNSTITGLDVLRYMLADPNYECCKTPQLECLREDLQSIFQLLNVCASLLLLGEIPENIKEELTDVVTELGNIAAPFFKGKQREISLKCLKHFGDGKPKPETEVDLDIRVEETVPYVKSFLRFGSPDDSRDYSMCSNYSVNMKESSQGINQGNLIFLTDLEAELRDPRYMADFARKLQEPPIPLIFEQINSNDQELVLVKVLHEVRFYIHLYLNKNQLVEHREQIEDNITRLRAVEEEVTEFRTTEELIKGICERFIHDLQTLHANPNYCNNQEFFEELRQLWIHFMAIQTTRRTSV